MFVEAFHDTKKEATDTKATVVENDKWLKEQLKINDDLLKETISLMNAKLEIAVEGLEQVWKRRRRRSQP